MNTNECPKYLSHKIAYNIDKTRIELKRLFTIINDAMNDRDKLIFILNVLYDRKDELIEAVFNSFMDYDNKFKIESAIGYCLSDRLDAINDVIECGYDDDDDDEC